MLVLELNGYKLRVGITRARSERWQNLPSDGDATPRRETVIKLNDGAARPFLVGKNTAV